MQAPAPGAPYTVKLTDTVPHDRVPMLGNSVPVTVSQSDPQRIEIDWKHAPSIVDMARASADAARRGDSAGAARALGFEPTVVDDPALALDVDTLEDLERACELGEGTRTQHFVLTSGLLPGRLT